MTSAELIAELKVFNKQLTRLIIHTAPNGDADELEQLLEVRDGVRVQIERLMLQAQTTSLAQIRDCCETLASTSSELRAIDARSENITKALGIAAKTLKVVAAVTSKLVGA